MHVRVRVWVRAQVCLRVCSCFCVCVRGTDLTSTSIPSTYPHLPGGQGPQVAASHCEYSQMRLNSSTSWSEGPFVLLCCWVNRFIGFLSRVARFIAVRQCGRVVCGLSGAGTSPTGFSALFFLLQEQVLLCFGHEWRRISHILGTPAWVLKKSYHHPTNFPPAQTRSSQGSAPGCQ